MTAAASPAPTRLALFLRGVVAHVLAALVSAVWMVLAITSLDFLGQVYQASLVAAGLGGVFAYAYALLAVMLPVFLPVAIVQARLLSLSVRAGGLLSALAAALALFVFMGSGSEWQMSPSPYLFPRPMVMLTVGLLTGLGQAWLRYMSGNMEILWVATSALAAPCAFLAVGMSLLVIPYPSEVALLIPFLLLYAGFTGSVRYWFLPYASTQPERSLP